MKVTQAPAPKVPFRTITIELESPEEVKRLKQLTGEGMYHYLSDRYGVDETAKLCNFKLSLNLKLNSPTEGEQHDC